MGSVDKTDLEIAKIIESESDRQEYELNLIASENTVSPAVMEVQGSILTNKYAEGYPEKRYYGGCEFVDQPVVMDHKIITANSAGVARKFGEAVVKALANV